MYDNIMDYVHMSCMIVIGALWNLLDYVLFCTHAILLFIFAKFYNFGLDDDEFFN
jgi:hypothetical protein